VPGARRIDVGGRVVLPGFVDAHTHLVWAGNRAHELEKRLSGATYEQIAAAGGGILGTVAETRATPADRLTELALARIDALTRGGVTAVEIKSGYGLDLDAELKILDVAARAAEDRDVEIVATFMGAHTYPRELRDSAAGRERYLDQVCEEMIPRAAGLPGVRFADVFVDDHAFGLAEAERVLAAAKGAGLGIKVHADQLSDGGAASLAAEMGAASADHLEHVSAEGLDRLAASGTVAVLIPGASLFLKMNRFARGREMIDRGVPVALATDLNPGTCPCSSLPLVIQLACLGCGLTIDEAIVAATLNAAAACGINDRCGSIEPGKRCDLVVLDAADRRELVYRLGDNPLRDVYVRGVRHVSAPARD